MRTAILFLALVLGGFFPKQIEAQEFNAFYYNLFCESRPMEDECSGFLSAIMFMMIEACVTQIELGVETRILSAAIPLDSTVDDVFLEFHYRMTEPDFAQRWGRELPHVAIAVAVAERWPCPQD